jgi:hypothetical protein
MGPTRTEAAMRMSDRRRLGRSGWARGGASPSRTHAGEEAEKRIRRDQCLIYAELAYSTNHGA